MWPAPDSAPPRGRVASEARRVGAATAKPSPGRCAATLPAAGRDNERPHPLRRRHHARHARQGRTAGAACAPGSTRSTRPGAGRCSSSSPARCASACRRGSPRPRSRRSATRSRTRSSCCGRRSRRPTRPVRLDRGPRREAGQQRSGAVPAGDAEPRDRGAGFRRARSGRLRRRMEMGRHPRAGGRGRRRTAGASRGSIRAPARTFPALSRPGRGAAISTARSTASC